MIILSTINHNTQAIKNRISHIPIIRRVGLDSRGIISYGVDVCVFLNIMREDVCNIRDYVKFHSFIKFLQHRKG